MHSAVNELEKTVLDSNVKEIEATISSITTSLLDRAKVNDKAGWDRLVELYGPLVYQWCRQSGLNAQDASDIGQEVFAAVAKSLHRFHRDKSGDTFSGWLRTIVRNKVRDYWRGRQGGPNAKGGSEAQAQLNQLAFTTSDVAESETRMLFARVLEFAKDQIDPLHWKVFWRVVVEGESPAEVALAMEVKRHQIYVIKSRILRTLREVFEEEMNGAGEA